MSKQKTSNGRRKLKGGPRLPIERGPWHKILLAAVNANIDEDGGDHSKAPEALWKWEPHLFFVRPPESYGVPYDDAFQIAEYLMTKKLEPEVNELALQLWFDSAP